MLSQWYGQQLYIDRDTARENEKKKAVIEVNHKLLNM